MKNIYLVFITAGLLNLASCSDKGISNSEVEIGSRILLKRDSAKDIRLSLDQFTKLSTRAVRYLDYGEEDYLLFLNDITNSIYRYNLNNSENPGILSFEEQGPMGVGKITGFDVDGPDSLFLLSRYDYKLTLVENPWTQVSLNTFRLSGPTVEMTPYATTQARMVSVEGKLYVLSIPFFRMGTSSFLKEGKNLLILDLGDSSIELKNIYSKIYGRDWSAFYGRGSLAFNDRENKFVSSFAAESGLLTFSTPQNVDFVPVNSTLVKEVQLFDGEHNNQQEEQMHLYENPRYIGVYFDKFRNVYYRLVHVPNPSAVKTKDVERLKVRSIVIQVFDRDFELIGEQELPPYYFHEMVFVGKKGLFVGQPELGPNGVEEDVIRYACFSFQE